MGKPYKPRVFNLGKPNKLTVSEPKKTFKTYSVGSWGNLTILKCWNLDISIKHTVLEPRAI